MLAIIFSKDRPLQLDATLRSFILHCRNFSTVSIKVIVRASTERYARAYSLLEREYRDYSNIDLVTETDFRSQVIQGETENTE